MITGDLEFVESNLAIIFVVWVLATPIFSSLMLAKEVFFSLFQVLGES